MTSLTFHLWKATNASNQFRDGLASNTDGPGRRMCRSIMVRIELTRQDSPTGLCASVVRNGSLTVRTRINVKLNVACASAVFVLVVRVFPVCALVCKNASAHGQIGGNRRAPILQHRQSRDLRRTECTRARDEESTTATASRCRPRLDQFDDNSAAVYIL